MLAVKALRVAFDTAMWVDSATSRVPFVREAKSRLADMILDRVFGPPEDFDYTSTTAPSSPPPSQ